MQAEAAFHVLTEAGQHCHCPAPDSVRKVHSAGRSGACCGTTHCMSASVQSLSDASKLCAAGLLCFALTLPPQALADEIPDDLPFAPSRTVPATMEMKVGLPESRADLRMLASNMGLHALIHNKDSER